MKICIREIPPQGLEIKETLDPKALGLYDDDLKCVTPVVVEGNVERIDPRNVLAGLHVKGTFSSICGRCLEPIAQTVDQDLTLSFEVDKKTEFIELDEDIRQELILALPPVTLCKEDCKGLCPGCGANLNTEKCKCKKG
ncbi:MAG: hypothetical protein A2Z88_04855 [Omnitrophica WOR_2 bacterium GWA2_47_8]|nr:MAG: hypothetical protein A2Z88_04855 [Omnitrophica WOR_2 bacterium GWA2_47_8]